MRRQITAAPSDTERMTTPEPNTTEQRQDYQAA
jgi:hypothetical protein